MKDIIFSAIGTLVICLFQQCLYNEPQPTLIEISIFYTLGIIYMRGCKNVDA